MYLSYSTGQGSLNTGISQLGNATFSEPDVIACPDVGKKVSKVIHKWDVTLNSFEEAPSWTRA